MPDMSWSELTPALWSIIGATMVFWIISLLMLAYILVPPFRGTRLGRFVSNKAYDEYKERTKK